MARRPQTQMQMKICDVTGISAPVTEFYSNQSHLKSVDRLRSSSGATKAQIARFYQALPQ
jgi:hypothetical protein